MGVCTHYRGDTMKVALGTLELDDDTRKKLGKVIVGSSYLKRDQARDWALGLINDELDKIRAGAPAIRPPVAETEPAAGYLPEPPTPVTGGLGAAGIPGGTA
jgi:hypothetical protein